MTDQAEALSGLRPINPAVDAGGVTALIAMALIGCACALALALLFRVMARRCRAIRRSALAELATSRSLQPDERLAAQAALLRRVIRTVEGDAPARLRDKDWLACLDRTFGTSFFTGGGGRAYGEALYRPSSSRDVEALDHALAGFFARLPK